MHVFILGSTNTAVAHPQSLLQAVGVGAKNSLPAAAGINWVLKDGLGRLGRLSVSTRFGTSFDSNLKVSLHSLDTGVGTEPPAHLGKHPAQMAFHHSPMCLKASGVVQDRQCQVMCTFFDCSTWVHPLCKGTLVTQDYYNLHAHSREPECMLLATYAMPEVPSTTLTSANHFCC